MRLRSFRTQNFLQAYLGLETAGFVRVNLQFAFSRPIGNYFREMR